MLLLRTFFDFKMLLLNEMKKNLHSENYYLIEHIYGDQIDPWMLIEINVT